MTAANLALWPDGAAAIGRLGRRLMEIILHLGAHRTGTTTFQHYLRQQQGWLAGHGVAVWLPPFTRKSVLPGLFRETGIMGKNVPQRAAGRIGLLLHRVEAGGAARLIVSDENLMGSCVENLREGRLYPAVGSRIARVAKGMRGQVRKVLLTIRAQDDWWPSAATLAVSRGHAVPSARRLSDIVAMQRGWRDVIADLARTIPHAEILVFPFEEAACGPDRLLQAAIGGAAPAMHAPLWHNRSASAADLRVLLTEQGRDPAQIPDTQGRWQPFTPTQGAHLHEAYLDDLHWLQAGADGLARLTGNIHGTSEAQTPGRTG